MAKNDTPTKIIHIDMDYFYAQCELLTKPQLINLPVAVGGSPNSRGVICTCNYIARKYGIKSAMASSYALKLCPKLIILPVNMGLYKSISQRIMQIFKDYTELVEPLSLDEAFLDVSNYPSATIIANEIRSKIYQQENLTASAGVSINKFLAKVASGINKPNGIYVVPPKQVMPFILSLPVDKFFGVGKITSQKLHKLNIYYGRDLHNYSLNELSVWFGKLGNLLYYQSRGIDNRPVNPEKARKSLSVEITFSQDLLNQEQIKQNLNQLISQLISRYHKLNTSLPIKSLFIKLKFSNFTQKTKEFKANSINHDLYLYLLNQAYFNYSHNLALRLLGVGINFKAQKPGLNPQLF